MRQAIGASSYGGSITEEKRLKKWLSQYLTGRMQIIGLLD